MYGRANKTEQYMIGGLSPCLNCGCHSGVEPKIMVYYEAGNNMSEQQGEW